MDSLTHGLIGGCIAIISLKVGMFDSEFYAFVLSIAASLLPDVDVLTRVSGKNNYIRVHRGLSHNFFMWFIYALLAGFIGKLFNESFIYSAIIVFAAVGIHVLLDGLNSYGVKFTPKSRYIRVGLINTVDVFLIIFLILFIGLYLVFENMVIFMVFGLLIGLYFLLRLFIFLKINRYIKTHFHDYLNYKIYCAINSFKYEAIIEYKKKFKVVDFYINHIRVIEKQKSVLPEEYLYLIKSRKIYKTFTNFSPCYYTRLYDYGGDLVKVKLTDLRYHKKNGFFYFNCIFIIDKEKHEVLKEDISFSISRKRIMKKYWI